MTPKAYFKDLNKIRAFVLGCDPTAIEGKEQKWFEFVFDIGGDRRYFSSIQKNLEILGLEMNDIYVQNLITAYQAQESTKNTEWYTTAKNFIHDRKSEFDTIDSSQKVPVFLTSYMLYKVLLKHNVELRTAKELYSNWESVPIPSDSNLLNRPLIPLFRHSHYLLSKWPEYVKHIREV